MKWGMAAGSGPGRSGRASRYRHNARLIRGATRLLLQQDRKAVFKALRPIYTAVNEMPAAEALDDLEPELGER